MRRIHRVATAHPVAIAAWLILLAIGVSSAVAHPGELVGDQALIELQMRELFSLQPPLTGPYSRYGWAHPGPAMFIMMAPAYFVFGASGTSLMVGAAMANATFGAASVALVERSHRRSALAMLGFVLVVLLSADESILAEPWNPRATILPLVLLVAAATAAASGDDVGAGAIIVSTVFVVSAHAGIGVAVVPLSVCGLGLWLHRCRRRPPRWSLGIAAVLTAPMIIDIVVNWPGNPGRLLRFALTDDTQKLGLQNAARFVIRSTSPEFLMPGRYDGFAGLAIPTQPLGLLPGLLIAALLFLVWRGGSPTIKHAALLILVGFAGSALSISNIRGGTFEYLLLSLPVLAACGWGLVASHSWTVGARRLPSVAGMPTAIGFALVGLLAMAAAVSEVRGTQGRPEISAIVHDAVIAVAAGDLDGPIIVVGYVGDAGNPFATVEYFGGVVNELDRRGLDVRVLPGTAEIVGDKRDGNPATSVQAIITVLPFGTEPPDRGAVIYTSAPDPEAVISTSPLDRYDVVRVQVFRPVSADD